MGSETQTCIHCGDPLSGRQAKFCSRRCHDIHPHAYDPAKVRSSYKARTCEVCGATYRPTYGAQLTCGRLCGKILVMVNAGRPLSMPRLHGQHSDLVVCPVCGRRSEKKGNRVYCPPCHEAFVLASRVLSWAQNLSANPTRECLQCGAAMPRGPGCGGRATCPTCGKANTKAHRAATAGYRKRARHYGVPYETIDKCRVFERDGYRCHICGCKTTLKGKSWAPRRASLDHLIPLSRGGAHSYVNVACACFECNSLKSAGVGGEGDQLRLLGG